jgi:hypothetical protein
VTVERRLRNLKLFGQQRGGYFLHRRAFQHLGNGLQDQQLLFANLCCAGFVHGGFTLI